MVGCLKYSKAMLDSSKELRAVTVHLSQIYKSAEEIIAAAKDKQKAEQYVQSVITRFNKSLISFGTVIPSLRNKKKTIADIVDSFIEKAEEEVEAIANNTGLDTIYLFVDSGGYQALTGKLTKSILDDYIDAYHTMASKLTKHFKNRKIRNKTVHVRVFTLDIPPCTKQHVDDAVDLNTSLKATQDSYFETERKLYEIKDSIIVVFHIGFTSIAKTFYNLFEQARRLLEFPNWSTSTMRKYANAITSAASYVTIAYMFLKSLGITDVKHFHYLGVSAPKFTLPLFYVSKYANWSHITYDSTSQTLSAANGTARLVVDGRKLQFNLKTDLSTYGKFLRKKLDSIGLELDIHNNKGRLTREAIHTTLLTSLEAQIVDEFETDQIAEALYRCAEYDGTRRVKVSRICLMKALSKHSSLLQNMNLDYNVLSDIALLCKYINAKSIEPDEVLSAIKKHLEPLPATTS